MNFGKSARISAFVLTTSLLFSNSDNEDRIPDADELHAAPTPLRSLLSSVRVENKLYLFNANLSEYASMPFDLEAKNRQAKFGSYTDVTRIKSPATKIPGDWRGIIASTNTPKLKSITLWDASMLQLVQINEKDNSIIQETAAPNDSIKPPRDRSGEPTQKEIQKARATFKANYRKVFGPRYTGLTPMPSEWDTDQGRNKFFVTTKIQDFPLTILSCDKNDSVACYLDRFCFLEGGPKMDPKNVSGTAVFNAKQKRLLMIGDSSKNKIHVYRYNSCFDLRFIKSLALPKLHGKLTSITSDKDANLWITTDQWDNRFDSNLFYWDLHSLNL